MTALIVLLCCLCVGQGWYLWRIRRQLSEWLIYLSSTKDSPERKSFVQGKGLLAEINFEMNDILEGNRKQLVKLHRAEEANKQILANLSHDVRTPLASLIGYLEALEQGRVKDEKAREYTQVAYHKALDIQALVEVLFEWFRINAKEQQYQKKEYDINELTRQIVIGYLPVIEQGKIQLEVNISDEEWFVLMDRLSYERILNNLFDNAIKHGKCAKIMLETQADGETVSIEVANDGAVISKEELPHIFERLYKSDTSRTNSGNGLGLAIARELVTAMQGEITAKSETGKTSFLLTFPRVRKK